MGARGEFLACKDNGRMPMSLYEYPVDQQPYVRDYMSVWSQKQLLNNWLI